MHTKETLLEFLHNLGIETRTVVHAPVDTVEAAKQHRDGLPGAHTKNLFLKDKKGRMFLVTTDEDRAVDLKRLRSMLGVKSLSFASADRLMACLGVAPGSVTPLAAVNDTDYQVTVAIDRKLVDGGIINVHPLVNTATTAMRPGDLIRFFEAVGHSALILDF
ncbi:MAG: prolyl-tRNA synthetase associated domain-containing protein [Rhodospirillales bacterium]